MSYWFDLYYDLLLKSWYNMTPMQYGYLLIGIGAAGWLLMKGAAR